MQSPIHLAVIASLMFVTPGLAQDRREQINGVIQKVDGRSVTGKSGDGRIVTFDLTPTSRVVTQVPLDVRTIKAGDTIVIDAVIENGKEVAIHTHTENYPHAANARARRKLTSNPNATRYLGVVNAALPTTTGKMVTVVLERDVGSIQIELTNSITNYRNELQTMKDVKPNLPFRTSVNRGADGRLSAEFMYIETNGHKLLDNPD